MPAGFIQKDSFDPSSREASQSQSRGRGYKVKTARVPNTGCTPDSTAIAWLLLQATRRSQN